MTLSLEQSFQIALLRQQVSLMSAEQLQKMLIETYTVMLEKDNAYKQLIAHKWGIDINGD